MEKPGGKKFTMSRGSPKSGAIVIYRAGDDASFQQGWTILPNAANGRFKIQTIGADEIVIDRATGLMWARSLNQAGCNNNALMTWDNAIDYALALNFAGFADWRIPNYKELASILFFSGTPNFPPVGIFTGAPPHFEFWTSTTFTSFTGNAYYVDFAGGTILNFTKTSTRYIRCVRGGFF